MQAPLNNATGFGQFWSRGIFFGVLAAVAMLAAATITGAAAPDGAGGSSDDAQAVTMQEDDAIDAQSLEEESGEGTDDTAGPTGGDFVPGVTHVVDAELGPAWLDDEPEEQASGESTGLVGDPFIPGVTDVLDAEDGILLQDTEDQNDHPARPDQIGPYK